MANQEIKPRKPDFILLFSAVIILAVGLIMVLSSSSSFSLREFGDPYYLFLRQLKWIGLGIVVTAAAVFFPYKYWRKLSGISMIVSVILLLLVEFSTMSITTKGSARWIELFGISVQPSEIAKLAIVLFFAYTLSRRSHKKITDMGVALFALAVIFLLVYKQPDLGTAIVILAAGGAMLLMTELHSAYFMVGVPIMGIVGFFLIKGEEYQWKRILGWLHPWEYATSHGWQLVNAQIAFATGGLLGIGIGRSSEGLSYLPESYTDTIYAVIGQEFGFFGTAFMLFCYAVLFVRGYMVSKQCPDNFGRLLGFGITTILAIQTAINLCVVTGLFPVTGITLPLISYGGSSLLVTMFEIGILLNISRYREQSA
ncbi:putative lipid II flippase FtsW [Dehalobacter sp. DCM]|uniref:putative lipid II flippase FtsW n=1 Tax=Dehalobacter sp. DCM TaxID=2907827 RepID=UPI0030814021|nr:putative lipid II flippase FtsW [Dehalobacter sp. DCM]